MLPTTWSESPALRVIELTSALAIKVRTQSIDREHAALFLSQFRRDVATGKREVFSIGEPDFAMADLLVERYAFDSRLRALDALQLAVGAGVAESKVGGSFCPQMRYFVKLPDLRVSQVINPEHSRLLRAAVLRLKTGHFLRGLIVANLIIDFRGMRARVGRRTDGSRRHHDRCML
jgi:hypothetical protein